MWSFKLKRTPCRGELSIWPFAVGWIGICVDVFGAVTQSHAQQLLPDSRNEIADQERLSWTLKKFPPQPYMNEVYWQQYSAETPAFFRESLLQYVARTYYLTRDNFDGSKSQAWAAGGWLAFRSGLIGDVFGVHAAAYTSQPIFAPPGEDGTKLLAPGQNSIGVLGQIYGRIQIGDQEIRGGRQLVDTPLINPQDNRMVPNTFEAATLVSLPDKERNYDYAVGYLWNIKQRDSNDFISMSDALAGGDAANHGAAFGMVKYRPIAGLSLTAMDYNVQDFVNTAFGQAEYDFKQPRGVPNWIVGANVIGQRSIGANLLTGPPLRLIKPLRRRRCSMPDGLCSSPVRLPARSPKSIHNTGPSRTTPTCSRRHSITPMKRPLAAASLTSLALSAFSDLARGRGTRMAGTPLTPALTLRSPIGMNWTSGYNTVRQKAR
jgi:hypothetical protein